MSPSNQPALIVLKSMRCAGATRSPSKWCPATKNDEIEAGALSSLIGSVDDPLGIVVLRQGVGDQCQRGPTAARTARKVLRARDDLHWPQQPILSSPT